MAKKKHKDKKEKSEAVVLSLEQRQELEMILDRLRVQDPEGKSLDSYAQSLRVSLAAKEPLAIVLMEKLSRNPTPVGFRLFRQMRDVSAAKGFRRAAKQAEYRFRQSGYVIETTMPETREVILVPEEIKQPVAHFSIPSPEGVWLLTALTANERFDRTFVSVMLEVPFTFVDLKVADGSQRMYRQFLHEMRETIGCKFLEIPTNHAARLFFEVLELAGERGGADRVRMARKVLAPFYDSDAPPYAYKVFKAGDVLPPPPTETQIAELLSILPGDRLFFPRHELAPFWEQIRAIDQSVLVVSPAVKEERVRKIIENAADQVCQGRVRHALQRFFEEQALAFHLSGQERFAEISWTFAQHLSEEEMASRNPVIVKLVSGSFYFHWQEEFHKKSPKGQGDFQRTESGLVLPW